MPPRAASTVLTDDRAKRLLDEQLNADAEHVAKALAGVALSAPLCCLGLLYVADEEVASVSYIYAWTEDERREAFDDDPEQALWTLWSPPDWNVDLDDAVSPPEPTADTQALTNALLEAGCEEPGGAFLMDLAHRLNRSPLLVPTTEDFACWATEHEMDDEPWLWMTAVARPEVVQRFARNGWLRLPDGELDEF